MTGEDPSLIPGLGIEWDDEKKAGLVCHHFPYALEYTGLTGFVSSKSF